MYDKVLEQAESFLKPMNEIWALNMEAMDTLREKQSGLVSEMFADGIEYFKGLATTTDADSFYNAQKTYWEGVQEKLSTSAQDSYELVLGTQEKIGELLQGAMTLESSSTPLSRKAKTSSKKKPSAKKAESSPAASISEDAPGE